MAQILSSALPEPEVDLCFLDVEDSEEESEEFQEMLQKIDNQEEETDDS